MARFEADLARSTDGCATCDAQTSAMAIRSGPQEPMNRTIFITGASSGIGKATAHFFHTKGWNVIATMRDPHRATTLSSLENVRVLRLDVTDPESIDAAVSAGIAHFGKIDVLLNNAGYGAVGLLEATSSDKIRRQFDTNVTGLLETTRAVLPHFRANGKGIVINISSTAGIAGFPLSTLYCATKFAVEGLTEALGFELEAIGLAVKLIEPGNTGTDFSGRSLDLSTDDSLLEYREVTQKFAAVAAGRNLAPAADPLVVAEVVYRAATDGTRQLRYTAGDDARALALARKSTEDEIFRQGIRDQFGL